MFQRQQVVYLGSSTFDIRPVCSGVPQSSILGSLLFIIFYNDFVDCIHKSQVLMYADDSVMYSHAKSVKLIEKTLMVDLKLIGDYFDENELVIHLKTEVMLFGTAKRISLQSRQMEVKFRETTINNTETYMYLGYMLDTNLSLRDNFDKA